MRGRKNSGTVPEFFQHFPVGYSSWLFTEA
jgi:hypothetical protein